MRIGLLKPEPPLKVAVGRWGGGVARGQAPARSQHTGGVAEWSLGMGDGADLDLERVGLISSILESSKADRALGSWLPGF